MKTKLIAVLLLSVLLFGCSKIGTTELKLTGSEPNLPEELKGLKVYTVAIDNEGSFIKVALLNGQVNSTTYQVGKITETVVQVEAKPIEPEPSNLSKTDKEIRILELERQILNIEREIDGLKNN